MDLLVRPIGRRRVEVKWWTVLTIQTDYSTPTAALGRLAHSHCEALSLTGYSWLLADKVWQNPNGAACTPARSCKNRL